MEEKGLSKSHKVTLMNRRNGTFTGILDVLSFDIAEILLETELGLLHLKGKDLHVNRLDLERGEVDVEGEIVLMEYTKMQSTTEKRGAFLGRLFQ